MEVFIWEEQIKNHHASWILEMVKVHLSTKLKLFLINNNNQPIEPNLLNDGAIKNGIVAPHSSPLMAKIVDNVSEYDFRYFIGIFISRKPSNDLTNVVLPLFFIGLLAGLAPLVRINGGERISFIITTQLGNILMLTIIEDNTSSSVSGEKPRILDFYTIVQACCFYSLIGTSRIPT